ncbi:MAG: SURF1 family protein [Chloroflexota bacterium]|jgi:surfeit locus 1 family protein
MSKEINEQSAGGSATTPNKVSEQQTQVRANVPISRLPRTFFSRRWWWATLLVIILMAVFIRLGFWQLSRRQERLAANAAYVAQISQSPVILDASYLDADPEELADRTATAQGRYDYEQQILLTQQSWLGRPGADLVTPLVLADGQTAVLVDRGWIPAADAEQADLSQFEEPGPQSINGVVQLSQVLSGGRTAEVDGPQQRWYRVEIEAIQEQMPYRLLPFYLVQTPPDGVQEDLPYRVSVDYDLSEGPHLGYAIQWFLFATVLAIGYMRFVSTQDGRSKNQ